MLYHHPFKYLARVLRLFISELSNKIFYLQFYRNVECQINNALIALIGTMNLFLNLKLQAVYTILLVCQLMLNAVALLCCARLYAHWRLETQTEGICQFVLCIGIRFQLERYTNTGRFRLSFKCSPKTPRLLSSINCRYFTFGIDTPILLLFSLFLFTWGFI